MSWVHSLKTLFVYRYKTDGTYKKNYLESKKGSISGKTGTEETTKETTVKDKPKSVGMYKI